MSSELNVNWRGQLSPVHFFSAIQPELSSCNFLLRPKCQPSLDQIQIWQLELRLGVVDSLRCLCMVSVAAVAATGHFNSPMTAIGVVVVVTAVTVWWLPVRPLLYHKRRFYAN